MHPTRLLLVEDDPAAGSALEKVLRAEGYAVTLVTRGDDAMSRVEHADFDVVLTDFRLPGINGLEVISRLRRSRPQLPVILMTAHGNTATAIEATKLGACDYLTKPFEVEELLGLVETAVAGSRRTAEPPDPPDDREAAERTMLGNSRAMQTLYKEIGRIAATTVPVLLRGETGVGKELVAETIHRHGNRASRPFIAVNCAAIPQSLVESELFGHERGAFTGAVSRRIGRFEQADGGTLFLDEIGDLSVETQAKLLRVLQERTIRRVGGDDPIPVDVRILAATHRDLETAMREREFREDLFFRLGVVTLHVPPLSQRTEDIPALVHHFIRHHAPDLGIENAAIDSQAVELLATRSWPGNVRELENVVRRALLAAKPFAVGVEHVLRAASGEQPARNQPSGPGHATFIADLLERARRGEIRDAYWQMISELEPELYSQAIKLAGGNQAKAARWLGVTRLKMREKLAELGLHPRSDQKPEGLG
jgi:nitrogen regulation protein NR(I)